MPRLPRLRLPGVPQHIVQRGNNRHICFAADEDFFQYINCLKKYSRKHHVRIHAWVLMTNHVHLLATPTTPDGLSCMIQDLGRKYVSYFNKTYSRTGTLWEGRFKSCLVDSNNHLLQCYRYIELNPVRAGMVGDPAHYNWSSYQCNAQGRLSSLITPHPEYLALGATIIDRIKNYKMLFKEQINEQQLGLIRQSLNSGMALGSNKFKDEMEGLLKRRVRLLKPGRPKKT